MKHRLLTKAIILIIILTACILSGNMLFWLVAKLNHLNAGSEKDIMLLISGKKNIQVVKLAIAFNHIIVFILGPMLFLMIFYRKSLADYISFRHFNPVFILLFPLALFALYPLMGYITFFTDQIEWPDFLSKMDKDSINALAHLLNMNNVGDLIINLIIVGILPGIGEELLFRGIIQKELTISMGKNNWPVWISAILFSVFHFQISGFIPKMMIGLMLGYALYFSGSLLLSMFLHALNNSFATLSLYATGGKMDLESIPEENVPLSGVFLSTLVFTWLMYQIYSVSKKNSEAL